jgi:hypothetical protein
MAKGKEKEQTPAMPEWTKREVEPLGGGGLIEVAPRSFAEALDFCAMLVKTRFLPETITMPAQAMAIILRGQEIGVPMMASLNLIHVIKGKPTLSSELMLAKFLQRGGNVKWVNCDSKGAVGIFTSAKGITFESVFVEADAKRAGLLGKDNWKNHPGDMYIARCISRGVRRTDPEAILGLHTPDEIDSSPGPLLEASATVRTEEPAAPGGPVDLEAPMQATASQEETEGAGDLEGPPVEEAPPPAPEEPAPSAPVEGPGEGTKPTAPSEDHEERQTEKNGTTLFQK